MARADRAEQRHAFLARRGVGAEVHVLDDEVDGLALEHREARPAASPRGACAMSRSENSTSSAVATAGLSSMTRTVGIARCSGYTLRVAIAGGIIEARSAGPSTASWPSSHSRRRADRQERPRQPRHLVLVHQPQVDRVGERHADARCRASRG